jgi:membrane-bound serine protease (ClpP class)
MVDYDVNLWEASVDGQSRVLTLYELERLEQDASLEVERITEISPKGKLLSLTSGEAYRYGLIRGLADDQKSLLSAIGASSDARQSAPSAADGIISFLTSGAVQAILIVLGIAMIFLEINTPGFGIPGVAAIIAFALVFGSGALLGHVSSLEIVLFLLGVGLLAVEIFILPGFGVTGISGLILIGLSLIFSMQDFVIPRFEWEWSLMGRNAVVVTLGILLAITAIAGIVLLGPKIKIFDRLTLKTRITGTAGGPLTTGGPLTAGGSVTAGVVEVAVQGNETETGEEYAALAGKQGIAVTTLRPAGKAEIEGRFYQVEGDGVFIEQGSTVQVTRVRGNTVIVMPIKG